MRFERELDQDSVPEWRVKYLDYKTGKQKIRACVRAFEKANKTPGLFPRTPSRRTQPYSSRESTFPSTSIRPRPLDHHGGLHSPAQGRTGPASTDRSLPAQRHDLDAVQALQTSLKKPGRGSKLAASAETQPLKSPHGADQGKTYYGSMGSTPRFGPSAKMTNLESGSTELSRNMGNEDRMSEGKGTSTSAAAGGHKLESPETRKSGSILWRKRTKSQTQALPSLKLPEPALATQNAGRTAGAGLELMSSRNSRNAYPNSDSTPIPQNGEQVEASDHPRRSFSTPLAPFKRPTFLHRVLSTYSFRGPPRYAISLEAYKEFDACQEDFFRFLEEELKKVEEFYKEKEDEANRRMETLQEQLELMRSRHLEDMAEQRRKLRLSNAFRGRSVNGHADASDSSNEAGGWTRKFANNLGLGQTRLSQATSNGRTAKSYDESDHERRAAHLDDRLINDVPYKDAKARLKHALQDFYKNLEMLKSYALLNRTAFRKINKKYDKAMNTRQTGKFMSEKVDQAWFVQSNVLESHLSDVEYLYARHFAKGSHKFAVKKLRTKHQLDHSSSSFRVGLLLGAGTAFAIRGIVYASDALKFGDNAVKAQTPYLLQIYAGYFLALLLFFLFIIDCRIWISQKINYVFIFEFDTRHNLDWRELAEIPSLLWFAFGLVLWLNFRGLWGGGIFLYWPVILVIVSAAILFLPVPFLYARSRLWWAVSNLRLYTAGYFPVEFRDFLLGDMYCSLTYTIGNAEVFFCLYSDHWENPGICGSSASRLLGVLTCLPGLWRLGQCMRRYHDTRMVFPHIANSGKYLCTVLYYMTLSIYRIEKGALQVQDPKNDALPRGVLTAKAFFIFFATLNSIYVSLWDVLIDWSLGHANAEWPLLREPLGFNWPVAYYFAMVVDPLIRFNWIFLIVLSDELQRSAMTPFIISLTEILRRAFWALFRVENEHMTNVGMFRASRDIPLPYHLHSPEESPTAEARGEEESQSQVLEAQTGQSPKPMSTPRRMGAALQTAHAHDFERKKPREMSSDEEDDDDDDDDDEDRRAQAQQEEEEEQEIEERANAQD